MLYGKNYFEQILCAFENNIKNNIILPKKDINNVLKKLQPFHISTIATYCFKYSSTYYFNEINNYQTINPKILSEGFYTALDNPSTTKEFFINFFNKNPDFLISKSQEKIVQFPLDYYELLFSKTLLSASKTTKCLYELFKHPKDNQTKLQFITDNQKKGRLPFHQDMYYFMLFTHFMETNSVQNRTYYPDINLNITSIHPVKITENIQLTSDFIFQNFPNIGEFIKPLLLKKTYNSKNFGITIHHEYEFVHFIHQQSSMHLHNQFQGKIDKFDTPKIKPIKI